MPIFQTSNGRKFNISTPEQLQDLKSVFGESIKKVAESPKPVQQQRATTQSGPESYQIRIANPGIVKNLNRQPVYRQSTPHPQISVARTNQQTPTPQIQPERQPVQQSGPTPQVQQASPSDLSAPQAEQPTTQQSDFNVDYNINQNGQPVRVTANPILPNGEVMPQEDLDNYINGLNGSDDLKSADNLGIIQAIQPQDETPQALQQPQPITSPAPIAQTDPLANFKPLTGEEAENEMQPKVIVGGQPADPALTPIEDQNNGLGQKLANVTGVQQPTNEELLADQLNATGNTSFDKLYNQFIKPVFQWNKDKADYAVQQAMHDQSNTPNSFADITGDEFSNVLQSIRSANEAGDPGKVMQLTNNYIQGLLSNKNFLQKIQQAASQVGMSARDYLDTIFIPGINNKMHTSFVADYSSPELQNMYVQGILNNSLYGKLYKAATMTSTQKQLTDEASDNYTQNAGMVKNAISGAIGMGADAPLFGGWGSLGGKAVEGLGNVATKLVAKNMVKNLVEKGVTEEAATQAVKKLVADKIANTIGGKIAAGALQSGITLGGYNATNEIVSQVLGEKPFSVGNVLKSAGEGFVTGAATGALGPATSKLTGTLSGIPKVAAKVGGFLGETAVFTGADTAGKLMTGDEKSEDIDLPTLMQAYAENLSTLGAMKGMSAEGLRKAGTLLTSPKDLFKPENKIDVNGYINAPLQFTDEEKQALNRSGYNADNTEVFLSKVLSKKATPQQKQDLTNQYVSIMANQKIPMSVKGKLMYLIENKLTSTPPLATAYTINQDGNKFNVTTLDKSGGLPIEIKSFDSQDEANNYVNQISDGIDKNKYIEYNDALQQMENAKALQNGIKSYCQKHPTTSIQDVVQILQKDDKNLTSSDKVIADEVRSNVQAVNPHFAENNVFEFEKKKGLQQGAISKIINTPNNKRTGEQQLTLNDYFTNLTDTYNAVQSDAERMQKYYEQEQQERQKFIQDTNNQINTQYNQGYAATDPQEKANITNQLKAAIQLVDADKLEEMTGTPAEKVLTLKDNGVSQDKIQNAINYFNIRAKYDGMSRSAADNINQAITENTRRIDEITHADGNIYQATDRNGNMVHVVSGDPNKNESVVIKDQEGNIQMVPTTDVKVEAVGNPEQLKQKTNTDIYNQLSGQYADEMNGKKQFIPGQNYSIEINGQPINIQVIQVDPDKIIFTDGKKKYISTADQLNEYVNDKAISDNKAQMQQPQEQLDEKAQNENEQGVDYWKGQRGNTVSLNINGKQVRGEIGEEREVNNQPGFDVYDEDGRLIGNRPYSVDELNNMMSLNNPIQSNTVEQPVQESTKNIPEANNVTEVQPKTNQELTGQQPVIEQAPERGKDETGPQIPVDEKGTPLFNNVSNEDLTKYFKLNGMSPDDAKEYLGNRLTEAQNELAKLQKSKPQDDPDAAKFMQNKRELAAKVDEAQKKVDALKKHIEYIDSSNKEEVPAIPKPVAETQKKVTKPKKKAETISDKIYELGDPVDAEEAVMRALYQGHNLRWSSDSTHKGLGDELGLGNGKERRVRLWMTNNTKGVTPAKLAEKLYAYGEDPIFKGMDDNDIRGMIIDIANRYSSRGQLRDAIFKKHNRALDKNPDIQEYVDETNKRLANGMKPITYEDAVDNWGDIEHEADKENCTPAELAQYYSEAQAKKFDSVGDYLDYKDYLRDYYGDISPKEHDEILNNIDNEQVNGIHEKLPEGQRQSAGSEESNSVLQGEQHPVDEGRRRDSERNDGIHVSSSAGSGEGNGEEIKDDSDESAPEEQQVKNDEVVTEPKEPEIEDNKEISPDEQKAVDDTNKKVNEQLASVDNEIKDVQAQIKSERKKISEAYDTDKQQNLFGEEKKKDSLFDVDSDLSKDNVKKILDPLNERLQALQQQRKEIEDTRQKQIDDAAKAVRDQKNLDFKPNEQQISDVRKEVDTNPTDAQKEAGNYKKGHVKVDGMDVSIENPKGSTRSGKDADGKEWHTEMHNDYGYIRGTKGVDGDHVDVYFSEHPDNGNVYVVDQVNPKTGGFDEHKVMYGFDSEEDARKAYLSNYQKGWKGLGKITEVSKDDFKKWLDSSTRKTKPFADYKRVQNATTSSSENNKVAEKQPQLSEEDSKKIDDEIADIDKKIETTQERIKATKSKEKDPNSSLTGNDVYKIIRPLNKLVKELQAKKDELQSKKDSNLRFRTDDNYSDEEKSIINKAKENGTYLKAPNGNNTKLPPKQWAQVRTKQFKDWFGDWENDPDDVSKVVDENGEPKEVLHGTPNDFFTFDKEKQGSSNDAGWLGSGFYFYGDNPTYAAQYARDGHVISAFLNIKNPYYATEDDIDRLSEENNKESSNEFSNGLKEDGYDGVYYNGDLNQEWVAYEPEQIKSATDNKGTFSSENPDIRFKEEIMGKPITDEDVKKNISDAATEFSNDLHANINQVTDDKDLTPEQKGAKGWFDTKTGKVTVNMNNATSPEDVRRTIFHETIGHKGIRAVIGEENFNNFLHSVMKNSDIWKDIMKNYKGSIYDLDPERETEEYLARIAETEIGDRNIWQTIGDYFRVALMEAKINLGFRLSNNDIKSLLQVVYREEKSGKLSYDYQPVNVLRYRKTEVEESHDEKTRDYERSVRGFGFRMNESFHDNMASLKNFQTTQLGKDGKLEEYEDAYTAQNQQSSRIKSRGDDYRSIFIAPLDDEVNHMMTADKKNPWSRSQVSDYAYAKHGLERNIVVSFINSIRDNNIRGVYKQFNDYLHQVSDDLMNHKNGVNTMQDWVGKMKDKANELSPEFEKYYTDQAGLSTLYSKKENTKTQHPMPNGDWENLAINDVDDVEKNYDTRNLWNLVNLATKQTLQDSLDGGLVTRKQHDNAKDMFAWYIPLRGFDETTAGDAYEYMDEHDINYAKNVIKRMKGRATKADSPFAVIGAMGERAISDAEDNRTKQMLLNFVQNHQGKLATINKVWYINAGTKDEPVWQMSVPDIPEKSTPEQANELFAEHEKLMEEKEKEGTATQNTQGLNLRFQGASERQKNQHLIFVKRNGKDYTIQINGDPRVAQAINGQLDSKENWATHITNKILRGVAMLCTSENPEFVLRNLEKDREMATSVIFNKENLAYNKRWHMNAGIGAIGGLTSSAYDMTKGNSIINLVHKYNANKLDMNDERQKYFKEFILNGGETGYTNLLTTEGYEKWYKKQNQGIDASKPVKFFYKAKGKTWDAYRDGVEFLNRSAEDSTRFATYLTSRQMGRSIQRSISDAKEVTTNFNRHGTGKGIAGFFKYGHLFFNAGMQSAAMQYELLKKSPMRFIMAKSAKIAMGYAMCAVMNQIGKLDDYDNIPDWIRQESLCIPTGKNIYSAIPLSIENRAFYKLGDVIYHIQSHRYNDSAGEGILDVASSFMDILPMSVLEQGDNTTFSDVLYSFAPDQIKPGMEILRNEDWTGKPVHKESYNKNTPGYMNHFSNTAKWAIETSKFLNNVTGGNKYAKGGVNINPDDMEHLFSGYLGGAFTFWNNVIKTAFQQLPEAIEQKSTKPFELRNIPFARGFATSTSNESQTPAIKSNYYSLKNKMDAMQNQIHGFTNDKNNGIQDAANMVNKLMTTKDGRMYQYYKNQGYNKLIEVDKKELEKNPSEESNQKYTNDMQTVVNSMNNYQKGL
jgi:hypothetical protein